MLWGLKTCRVESYSRALWSLERGLCWRKEWKIEREGWRGGTAQSSVSAAMSKCGGWAPLLFPSRPSRRSPEARVEITQLVNTLFFAGSPGIVTCCSDSLRGRESGCEGWFPSLSGGLVVSPGPTSFAFSHTPSTHSCRLTSQAVNRGQRRTKNKEHQRCSQGRGVCVSWSPCYHGQPWAHGRSSMAIW